MSVSLVTFANLGRKRNLPTDAILPVIETLAAHHELRQIICQIDAGYTFPHTISAIPWPVRYALRALEESCGVAFSRERMDDMFDFFAQARLLRADVTLFHRGAYLPRTYRRANHSGSITIDISGTAHPQENARLEKEEAERLGVDAPEGHYARLQERSTCIMSFDFMIALSDFVRETYVRAGFPEDRIFVAHPDTDMQRFMPQPRTDGTFRVLYTGYTTMLKGLEYLLDAWQSLALPGSELVLLGGYGDIPAELKHRYDVRIEKDQSVCWIGPSHAPEAYYHDADALVFPSVTEGFGKVTIEAMASGLPVITTENARGIVENGKTGFVVPIRDSKALADKIRFLYDHRDMARQMGKAARKAVEDKRPFGEAVYEIYRNILRREGKL